MLRQTLSAIALLATIGCTTAARATDRCPEIELFAPGTVSQPDRWEWRLSFNPARDRVYWASTRGFWPATREQAVILTAHRTSRDTWSMPQVAAFSGVHSDFDPFVSPDGRSVFFSSQRPVDGRAKADMDLWVVRRSAHGWGTPQHLPGPSLDGYDELYPSVDRHGDLYFARVKAPVPTEDVEIWRSRRGADGRYAPAVKITGGVNTDARWEFNPEISPDGRTLLFTRLDQSGDIPPAGLGWGDLYVSHRDGDRFGPARNLGPCVNSADDEYHPTMLWERSMLYFVRNRVGGSILPDFHRVPVRLPRH